MVKRPAHPKEGAMIRADLFWGLFLGLVVIGLMELDEWLKRKSSTPRKPRR